jgi:hypothetical protein
MLDFAKQQPQQMESSGMRFLRSVAGLKRMDNLKKSTDETRTKYV